MEGKVHWEIMCFAKMIETFGLKGCWSKRCWKVCHEIIFLSIRVLGTEMLDHVFTIYPIGYITCVRSSNGEIRRKNKEGNGGKWREMEGKVM